MEGSTVSKQTIISGFFWTFGERLLAQMVSLVVGIVLARMLSPKDFGVISIVMVFIAVCDIFVSSGFGTAIVRQKEAASKDFNSAFYLSLSMAIALYFAIFFVAPYVASFYKIDILKPVMRVFGVRILFSAFNNIQQAFVQRQMKFKKFFIATLFGTVASCFVGITLAYNGFGVWALVAQYMTNSIVDTIALFIVGGWRPKLEFSISSAKAIYSFGWKMLCSQLVYTLSNDIRSLIIGKVFGPSDLAFYDQGKKYPAVIVDNINAAIAKVMLPTFARNQDNMDHLKSMLRRSIRTGLFCVAPLMCGFAAAAHSFVLVILTDKWLSAVPFIQIMCFSYITRPLEELCHRSILAIGKSGVVMAIMIVINTISIVLTIIATFVMHSVLWIALFYLVHTIVSLICFMHASNRYIGYRFLEQIKDLYPVLSASILMGLVVYCMNYIPINSGILLTIQGVSGILIYLCLVKLFRIDEYRYIKDIIKQTINKQ